MKTTSLTRFEMALKRCEIAKGPWPAGVKRCMWCGAQLSGRRTKWCSESHMRLAVVNHIYSVARVEALKRANWTCATCGVRGYRIKLEVNHKKPCKGKHSLPHCSHHSENLEVLCRPCHLVETARQRENGEI